MPVIVAGTADFDADLETLLRGAAPLIAGAKTEAGCLAYEWTIDTLVAGRLRVFEEWRSEDDLAKHLADHWYRDMLGYLGQHKLLGSDVSKYRYDLKEPVYDATGVPRGHFAGS
jgi:quinol monooxygenase YgiN